jgi:hypothetical protein
MVLAADSNSNSNKVEEKPGQQRLLTGVAAMAKPLVA